MSKWFKAAAVMTALVAASAALAQDTTTDNDGLLGGLAGLGTVGLVVVAVLFWVFWRYFWN